MPYVWVEPDKFMGKEETKDMDVHHCHSDGCLMEFHYQVPSEHSETGWMAFDIRDLKIALRLKGKHTHQEIILAALAEYPGAPLDDVVDTLIDWYDGETEGTPT